MKQPLLDNENADFEVARPFSKSMGSFAAPKKYNLDTVELKKKIVFEDGTSSFKWQVLIQNHSKILNYGRNKLNETDKDPLFVI